MKKLLILGGDGYLGWPAAMFFSANWEVTIFDSFVKRQWESIVCGFPLIPIPELHERVAAWQKVSGKRINFTIGDLCDANIFYDLMDRVKPDAIIHFAEQPSAPFSMGNRKQAVESQTNNLVGTLNVIYALKDLNLDAHLVKLGTMGEYGTPNIDIEEGFLDIEYKNRKDRVPFPKQPGSFYHLSKVFDSQNLIFASPLWGLRVTDLNQGVVYGVETSDTSLASGLHTSFHYDAVFGTCLNRFCIQAILGKPLTVYGNGGQKRSFINLSDSLKCISLALENPPRKGEFRVFNQFTEVFSLLELAEMVKQAGAAIGQSVQVCNLENPRVEKMGHYYNPINATLLHLGLTYQKISEVLGKEMFEILRKHKNRVNEEMLLPTVKWKS